MESCKNFIVLLSYEFVLKNSFDDDIPKHTKRHIEYDTSLSLYKQDKSRNLVFVNYDNLDSDEVSYRYHKAFINVGETITFAERIGKLLNNIEKQL